VARVEWTRQSGEDVEAVVAMLLCSRYPNAVRVRPSQGDGGIDVFVPGPAGFGAERAVYQVKKFSENLTSSQKRKIKRSYQRVVDDLPAEEPEKPV
jgi:predicted AAA+ superfamily ATPase